MRVSVFGIGYVGSVTSACLAESGHTVIAVDKDRLKVEVIQEGKTPVIEPGLDILIKKQVVAGNLKATRHVSEAILNSDISLVCVGTPGRENGSLDLSHVEDVCREIGAALAQKSSWHCVILRSTIMPGSAMNVILPILEKTSGKKAGRDFGFGNNPEFLREGSAIHDFFHPPKIVIGAEDEKTSIAMLQLYEKIEAPRAATSIAVAEGVKYANNAWHAVKIGFANEIGNILKAHDVDSHSVMDILCLDTKLNISPAYLKPGFAFGGSCLPKDLRALQAGAREKNVKTPLFSALLAANDEQIMQGLRMVEELGRKKVALLGLAFKPETDDLRESPLLKLAELLAAKNYDLKIYDPSLKNIQSRAGVFGLIVQTLEEAVQDRDIVVIGHISTEFNNIVETLDEDTVIIDLVRLGNGIERRKKYQGICW